MTRWIYLAVVLAVLLPVAPAMAQGVDATTIRCSLLVDASGSMDGYDKAPGRPLMRLIEKMRGPCPDTYAFGDIKGGQKLRKVPARQSVAFTDQNTFIGDALEQWLKDAPATAFALMMTDNIPDEGNSRNDPTQKFYNLLQGRDTPLSHITAMALRPAFQGNLYDPSNKQTRNAYKGPRAVAIYVLAKHAEANAADYADLRRSLEAILAASGYKHGAGSASDDDAAYITFDVKPLGADSFRIQSRAGTVAATQSASAANVCSANAKFDEATNTFRLLNQPMEEDCELTALVSVKFASRWCLVDTGLTADITMQADDPDVLKQSVQALQVDPPRANLCDREQHLRVGLKFSAFRFKEGVGFFDRLARTFNGSFEATGQLLIRGSVRRPNVLLQDELKQAWSYGSAQNISVTASADPKTQRKVFRLEEGVRAIIPVDQLDGHELIRYPVKVQVLYDQSPIFVLMLGAGLLLALLVLLFLLANRSKEILIEAEGGGETRGIIRLFGSVMATSDNGLFNLTVTSLGVLLLARSNGKIVKGRFLGAGGGRVEVAPAGARPQRRRRSPRADDDGYGYDGGDDGASNDGQVGTVEFHVTTLSRSRARTGDSHEDSF